jgi:peptidoglycan lytic transglycosylase
MRSLRPTHAVAGALMLAIPTSAVALSAGAADAQSAIQINLNDRHLAYGQHLRVTGNASSAEAGRRVVLEFAPAGSRRWQRLSSTTAHRDGSFKFAVALKKSGLVRAIAQNPLPPRTESVRRPQNPTPIAPSHSRPIVVASKLQVRSRSRDVLDGQRTSVSGRLLPEVGHRKVYLEGRSGRHWHWLASTRTGRHGGFRFRYRARGLGSRHVRVKFTGDRLNTGSTRGAGRLTVFRESLASWFQDAGATACGFHVTYGVANKVLPCGTRVTFRYGGRQVTATVEDRGPYVGGREWDLNQNTAAALGFGGVGMVWSTR